MDINTLNKVSSVSNAEAELNLGRWNRYDKSHIWGRPKQHDGGKLDRLQQYINKK